MKVARTIPVVALAAVASLAVAQEAGKKPDKPAMPSVDEMLKPPAPIQDAFLDSMVGTWATTTTFMGEKFEGSMTAAWSLNHQFLKSTETNKGEKGNYDAEGFMRVENGEYTGWMFDSMGSAGTMKGKLVGDALHTSGDDPKMGAFRGVTKRVTPDEFTWTMECDMERDGSFMPMGEGKMTRKKK